MDIISSYIIYVTHKSWWFSSQETVCCTDTNMFVQQKKKPYFKTMFISNFWFRMDFNKWQSHFGTSKKTHLIPLALITLMILLMTSLECSISMKWLSQYMHFSSCSWDQFWWWLCTSYEVYTVSLGTNHIVNEHYIKITMIIENIHLSCISSQPSNSTTELFLTPLWKADNLLCFGINVDVVEAGTCRQTRHGRHL